MPPPGAQTRATLPRKRGRDKKRRSPVMAEAAYAPFFRKKLHQPPGLTSPSTSWQVFGAWK